MRISFVTEGEKTSHFGACFAILGIAAPPMVWLRPRLGRGKMVIGFWKQVTTFTNYQTLSSEAEDRTVKKLYTLVLLIVLFLAACQPPPPPVAAPVDSTGIESVASDQTSESQIATLKTLLQDPAYALEIAQWLDAAYYKGQGLDVPDFVSPEDETAVKEKSVKEEKIAMNLAGFYAVEAGLGVLAQRTGETPVEILNSIVDGSIAEEDMLLFARFANATWKAGQPFRSLERIGRDSFIPAAMLTDEDLQKDFDQINAAAEKLSEQMQGVVDAESDEQISELKTLLQDPDFALEIAQWLDAAYYKGQGLDVPDFVSPEDETAVKEKSVLEEKIAMNLAGFYAVEAGLGVLAERMGETPIAILQSIVDGTLPQEDMLLLARFANATWKAGQPFRSLERIGRDSFIPAAMLTDDDLQKDFDQINAAAEKLLDTMQ